MVEKILSLIDEIKNEEAFSPEKIEIIPGSWESFQTVESLKEIMENLPEKAEVHVIPTGGG